MLCTAVEEGKPNNWNVSSLAGMEIKLIYNRTALLEGLVRLTII